jgi:hypothetical protein
MVFREIVAVYFVNHMEHMNTISGKNSQSSLMLKQRGTRINHCALLGKNRNYSYCVRQEGQKESIKIQEVLGRTNLLLSLIRHGPH